MKQDCIKIKGNPLAQGVAIGRISLLSYKARQKVQREITNAEWEISRYEQAKETLKQDGIPDAVREVLDDSEFCASIEHAIRLNKMEAQYAVLKTSENLCSMFLKMTDAFWKKKAEDTQYAAGRLIMLLEEMDPVIVAADGLTQESMHYMEKKKVSAFISGGVSAYSHMAIYEKGKNIPVLSGIPISPEWDGKIAVVDGYEGVLILEPDKLLMEEYRKKQQMEKKGQEMLALLRPKESRTKSGTYVNIAANIEHVSEWRDVLESGASGVGLFRTEFLFLESKTFPTEEVQFDIYRTVLQKMEGKRVVFRTMDIGAELRPDYFKMEEELNPAMGFCSIRMCLENPEMLKVQLRAILRAAVYGNAAVVYPMITSVEEVASLKKIMQEAKNELKAKDICFGEVEEGIMIETPAAVMISDLLAKEAAFFQMGTNDLMQYTMAADRRNAKLERFFWLPHPAVLRMIELTIQNAHKEKIRVSICGEMAADTRFTETFMEMGIDELSVSPNHVLLVKKAVRALN